MVDIKLIYGVLKTVIGLGFSSLSQMIKNLPAMQKTQVQSPSWEDPLEKAMATHSSILVWRIPWTEESGRLHGLAKESNTSE